MKNKNFKKKIALLFPFLFFFILFIFKPIAKYVACVLPKCYSNEILHIVCPGCGMTRSVIALLKGDIITSIRNNALCLILVIFIALAYLEWVFLAFGRPRRFLPRNKIFIVIISILIFSYLVARNFITWLAPVSNLDLLLQ